MTAPIGIANSGSRLPAAVDIPDDRARAAFGLNVPASALVSADACFAYSGNNLEVSDCLARCQPMARLGAGHFRAHQRGHAEAEGAAGILRTISDGRPRDRQAWGYCRFDCTRCCHRCIPLAHDAAALYRRGSRPGGNPLAVRTAVRGAECRRHLEVQAQGSS